LSKEISLYIYYENGDKDGIEEHEYVAPGAIAYVNGGFSEEGDGGHRFCHELFHAFMDDYNRTGMTGLSDSATYNAVV